MDVKELMESYGKLGRQLADVRRDLALYRGYMDGNETERAYWAEKAAPLAAEEESLTRQHASSRRRIQLTLLLLPDAVSREVLSLKHLDEVPFSKICGKAGYSLRQTYRIHQNALDYLRRWERKNPDAGPFAQGE